MIVRHSGCGPLAFAGHPPPTLEVKTAAPRPPARTSNPMHAQARRKHASGPAGRTDDSLVDEKLLHQWVLSKGGRNSDTKLCGWMGEPRSGPRRVLGGLEGGAHCAPVELPEQRRRQRHAPRDHHGAGEHRGKRRGEARVALVLHGDLGRVLRPNTLMRSTESEHTENERILSFVFATFQVSGGFGESINVGVLGTWRPRSATPRSISAYHAGGRNSRRNPHRGTPRRFEIGTQGSDLDESWHWP